MAQHSRSRLARLGSSSSGQSGANRAPPGLWRPPCAAATSSGSGGGNAAAQRRRRHAARCRQYERQRQRQRLPTSRSARQSWWGAAQATAPSSWCVQQDACSWQGREGCAALLWPDFRARCHGAAVQTPPPIALTSPFTRRSHRLHRTAGGLRVPCRRVPGRPARPARQLRHNRGGGGRRGSGRGRRRRPHRQRRLAAARGPGRGDAADAAVPGGTLVQRIPWGHHRRQGAKDMGKRSMGPASGLQRLVWASSAGCAADPSAQSARPGQGAVCEGRHAA